MQSLAKVNKKPLIIFDLDGVLIDSEILYRKMNKILFADLGINNISQNELDSFVGISANRMWQYLIDKFNLQYSVEHLINLEKELKHKTLKKNNLIPTNGIINLLKQLKTDKFSIAIASSNLRSNINLILNKTNIEKHIDFIISGEDIINGKPDPDIFLATANYFQTPPNRCIVIEDSTNGIMAAKKAGMFCIGFYNPNSGEQNLSQADKVITNFEITEFYKTINLSI